jgi:hypothetical protein
MEVKNAFKAANKLPRNRPEGGSGVPESQKTRPRHPEACEWGHRLGRHTSHGYNARQTPKDAQPDMEVVSCDG